MKKNNINFKLILLIYLINSIFNVSFSKNLDKFYREDKISNYFSGVLSFKDDDYNNSYKYLKSLKGLEETHPSYSKIYQYSLINLERFDEAFEYSISLEKQKKDSFENNLIIGVHYLKNKNYNLANKYFLKLEKFNNSSFFSEFISSSLITWISFLDNDYNKAKISLNNIPDNFKIIKKIQTPFLECYFNTRFVEKEFEILLSNQENNFSRYNFFYINYLLNNKKEIKASEILNLTLKKYPRNLNLNQLKLDLNSKKYKSKFDCKDISNVVAEIFYIASNILSSQSIYSSSNFYLNLAKYLNPDFKSFDTLYAENFFMIDNYEKSKIIYQKLSKVGTAYNWHSSKKLFLILINQKKNKEAIKLITKVFENIKNPGAYEIYEYADFLKNNEKFKESIQYYSLVLKMIDESHPLYSRVFESRGISYERIKNWEKAEKDLIKSLEIAPNEAYVINYLAYSWIEKGINIEESLTMLEKANNLKKNDGYIIDSLGWALFKLKRYKKAKVYLQQAVKIMPSDPVINDHYADALWMNKNKLQARYHWNYVLNLEEVDQKLKKSIKKKLILGLDSKI